jgi:hypothetical protein
MIATSQVLKRRDVLGMMLALEPSLSPQREKGIPCQWFGKIHPFLLSRFVMSAGVTALNDWMCLYR